MSLISLTELQSRIGQINEDHGFNELGDIPQEYHNLYVGNKLMLMVSELAEAQDEFRNGRGLTETYYNEGAPTKPEGLPSELADAVIRAFSLAHELGIDLEASIFEKVAYNATRPYRHGKLF